MKQRLLLLLATLCFLATAASAQISGPAYRIYSGPTLPATCDPGSTSDTGVTDVFIKTTATKGIYYCSATNTWTNSGGGGGGGTPGGSDTNVQINDAGSFNGYAGFVFDKTAKIGLGVAGTSVGTVQLFNATSGSISLAPVAGALGTVTISFPALTGTVALTTNNLGIFAATTSAQLAGVLSDETGGSGLAVFNSTPTIITPSFTTGFTIGGTAAAGTIPRGNGTNFVASTFTMAAPGTSGNVLTSDGTNWTSAAPAGGGGITIGTTTITSGTTTRFLYDNAGVVGETAGIVYSPSASTTFSVTGQSASQLTGLFTGAASSSSAILVAQLGAGSGGDSFQVRNSGGTAITVIDSVGSIGAGITSSLLGRVHGVAPAGKAGGFFQAASLDTATVLIARQGSSSTGDLIRGENSAGTALFAVNNSGNVNIGGVTSSNVRLTKFSNAYSAPSISLQGGAGADTLGAFHSGTASYGAAGATSTLEIAIVGASGGRITLGGGSIGFASASATGISTLDGNRDTEFTRAAQRVMAFGNGSAGHTFRSLPDSPTQITADQNNYQAGSGRAYFYRLSSDAARNITGLNPAGGTNQNGEVHILINVGSNNIVLVNESASSTAGNRFTNSTGADITLAANEAALVMYDGTSSRWRAFKY